MTDSERLFLLCVAAIFIVVAYLIVELVDRKRHNSQRKRAGRSLLDPRAVPLREVVDIDYKHLDARRAWRSILERAAS